MFSPNEAPDALCPKCGGRLFATVYEDYRGILLKVNAEGAWEYDIFDGDIVGSYVASVSCEDCGFSTNQPERLRCEFANQASGTELPEEVASP